MHGRGPRAADVIFQHGASRACMLRSCARAEGTTAEVGYSRRQETVQEESLRALSSAGGEREAHHASAAKANCKANDLPPCTIRAG